MIGFDRGLRRPRAGAALCLALAAGAATPSLAQSPGSLPALSELGIKAPATVKLAALEFRGNASIATDELQAVAAGWIGRELGAAQIEELRYRLNAFYAERGYLFAVVRAAATVDAVGMLRFDIDEGRLAGVNVRGADGLTPDYVAQRLAAEGPLNVNELLDRYRLLLTDPLFSAVRSRLQPGSEPGLAVLDIDVVRAAPYQVGVFANNYRPPSVGANAAGVAGWVKNLTGQGDSLEFNAAHSSGSTPLTLGWNTPLAGSLTRLNLGYSEGRSAVIEEPMKPIDIRSTSRVSEAGLTHSLAESLSRRVVLGLAYVVRESRTTLLGVPYSFTPGEPDGFSKTRTWRFSQEWSEVGNPSAFALRSAFNWGRDNNLGQAANAPDDRYFYWNGQANWMRNLTDNGTQLVLRGSAQLTHNRLLPMERAPVGGVNTVRGYRENQLVRDRSLVGSVEVKIPLVAEGKAGHNLFLVPFVDYGSARNQGETGESLRSAGLGANWRLQGWSADVYWGARLRSVPKPTDQVAQDHGLHFQLAYNFF